MFSSQRRKGASLTFRHFNRKGYALFACLGREVRIGVLSAATLAAASPCLAAAGDNASQPADSTRTKSDTDDTLLGEAVVQTARAPLAAEVAARQVMTLTRRELAAAGVTSINDVLKLAAGVDVRQRGGFGIQTDISIDGGTFDQLALLVNGIPVTNPQTGHNTADFPLNLEDVERIEVLRGAASRVFGSQAFSGAVNIVTRTGGDRLTATVEGGSYGTLGASARTAWNVTPRFTTSVSGSYRRSDGATDNSGFSGAKGWWQGTYDDAGVRIDAQAGITASDFEANTFYSPKYLNQWEATRRYLVAVKAETKGRIHFTPSLSWLRSTDHFKLIRDSHTGENFHRGDVYTAQLGAWTSWCLGRTAVGAEVREEGIYSTNLGRPLDESQQFGVKGHDGILYTKHDSRTNVSYFAEHNVILDRWTISAGVMAQRNTHASRHFSFYPGVDVSFRPADGVRLFASWNRSMRLPSFTDLYYQSPTQEGNVGLQAEECSSFRLGADWTGRVVSLSAGAYYTRGTNMIDWIMRTADDKYHATAFDLDNMGASLRAAVDFDTWLGRRQPLSRLTLEYAYIHQHRRRGEDYYKSNYAMEYLRHKFVATLDHRIAARLGATWTLRVQDREGAYLAYAGGVSTQELRPYGAHAILDCRLHWTARHYMLYADLSNLTAHRYTDIANVVQPGFTALFGVRLNL